MANNYMETILSDQTLKHLRRNKGVQCSLLMKNFKVGVEVIEIKAGEKYLLNFRAKSDFTMRIIIGPGFPNDPPVIHVEPDIGHPWVRNSRVVGSPNLAQYDPDVNLVSTVNEIISGFKRYMIEIGTLEEAAESKDLGHLIINSIQHPLVNGYSLDFLRKIYFGVTELGMDEVPEILERIEDEAREAVNSYQTWLLSIFKLSENDDEYNTEIRKKCHALSHLLSLNEDFLIEYSYISIRYNEELISKALKQAIAGNEAKHEAARQFIRGDLPVEAFMKKVVNIYNIVGKTESSGAGDSIAGGSFSGCAASASAGSSVCDKSTTECSPTGSSTKIVSAGTRSLSGTADNVDSKAGNSCHCAGSASTVGKCSGSSTKTVSAETCSLTGTSDNADSLAESSNKCVASSSKVDKRSGSSKKTSSAETRTLAGSSDNADSLAGSSNKCVSSSSKVGKPSGSSTKNSSAETRTLAGSSDNADSLAEIPNKCVGSSFTVGKRSGSSTNTSSTGTRILAGTSDKADSKAGSSTSTAGAVSSSLADSAITETTDCAKVGGSSLESTTKKPGNRYLPVASTSGVGDLSAESSSECVKASSKSSAECKEPTGENACYSKVSDRNDDLLTRKSSENNVLSNKNSTKRGGKNRGKKHGKNRNKRGGKSSGANSK